MTCKLDREIGQRAKATKVQKTTLGENHLTSKIRNLSDKKFFNEPSSKNKKSKATGTRKKNYGIVGRKKISGIDFGTTSPGGGRRSRSGGRRPRQPRQPAITSDRLPDLWRLRILDRRPRRRTALSRLQTTADAGFDLGGILYDRRRKVLQDRRTRDEAWRRFPLANYLARKSGIFIDESGFFAMITFSTGGDRC